MKRLFPLIILLTLLFTGCKKPVTNYTMEGKWTYPGNSLNTMYIYENGIRYTYYCVSANCDSLYNTFQAGDSNALPGTNNYTFVNDTLVVDLNFGNELVTPITFECDGGKANFSAPGYSLIRLNSGCNWWQRRSVKSIWASSSEGAFLWMKHRLCNQFKIKAVIYISKYFEQLLVANKQAL